VSPLFVLQVMSLPGASATNRFPGLVSPTFVYGRHFGGVLAPCSNPVRSVNKRGRGQVKIQSFKTVCFLLRSRKELGSGLFDYLLLSYEILLHPERGN
jgi:hypothetical protein